jgi:glycosyltransferase involved in cell wall biosynthesis
VRRSIVCTSEDIVRDFLKKYPQIPRNKFVVITNGFDPADFVGEVPLAQDFTVTHTGNLTGKRNCFSFLEGLKTFLDRDPESRRRTKVLFIGPRDMENELKAEELALTDLVSFQDTLPHGECVRLQRSSHLLLLLEHPSKRGAMIYPGKVFEYAASGRRILALVPEGAAARFVRNSGAGEVVSPSNTVAVADTLSRLFSAYASGNPIRGVRERSELSCYERPRLAADLAAVMEELRS